MLCHLSISDCQSKLKAFDKRYLEQWADWVSCSDSQRLQLFGPILRSWQGCRPNRMRRGITEAAHPPPFLEDLISQANDSLKALRSARLGSSKFLNRRNQKALNNLWDIFENLSYAGSCRDGKTGAVGISKATMLLTNGAIGPAFDSFVRRNLGVKSIHSAVDWIEALNIASMDVSEFELTHGRALTSIAPPQFRSLATGRLYDMILGPQ